MKRCRPLLNINLAIVMVLVMIESVAQKVTLDPTISPALFRYNTPITVTYDVTGTSLSSLATAWAWVWLPESPVLNANSNLTPASSFSSLTNPAKFTKSTSSGHTFFTITFTPSAFFSPTDISARTQIGILLKGNDWPQGQTSDFVTTFWDGSFQAKLTAPTQQPLFVTDGETIGVTVETPISADFTLKVNGHTVDGQTALTQYNYTLTASDTTLFNSVVITASSGGSSSQVSFAYIISRSSPVVARPPGIIDGINYDADPTKVTLSLWAPQKTSVYVIGDFTNWQVDPDYIMNRDGEHFWLAISGLTSGIEYGYQYLVDESLFVADPYADKVLDPDDQYIPAATYPNLKTYPAGALHTDWYFNRVPVLQTNQTPYSWQSVSYQRPAKEKLVIYELLIRDYFDASHRNYQALIDTLSYLKRLGVNAVELMPVMEFNGNDSWGYNPTFEFAPDKYYGTKNKLMEFVDICHQNGMAVILDIVMNHQDLPNPYALMYFDFNTYKPKSNNPWFNVNATHPYNVFYDLNHESLYTKKYLDTVNYHWLHDYKVDGLRFDLAKGFTQTNNPNDVNAWSAYDASRIAILKRMADKIWAYSPDAYVILELFSANAEEKELAEYRSGEGKGMMPWANFNYAYNQATMGYSDGSDISSMDYSVRGWSVPRAVGYMESHDEERLMYKNLQFGNSSGNYSVKTLSTALDRVKAANVIFYTIPGPKMLWEFGELGYDLSINTCTDGTTINNDCRIAAKPVHWEYLNDASRQSLHNHVADLARLHRDFPVFGGGSATISGGTDLVKQVLIKGQPYTETPSDSTEMNAVAVANLDLSTQNVIVTFSHDGTWYDYYNDGATLSVTGTQKSVSLDPGGFKLYTDVKITNQVAPVNVILGISPELTLDLTLFPNPVTETVNMSSHGAAVSQLSVLTLQGNRISPSRISETAWDVRDLSSGLYIAEVIVEGKPHYFKLLKK